MVSDQQKTTPPAAPAAPPHVRDQRAPVSMENADLFDYALIRDYGLFVLRAPLRHKKVALIAFVVTVCLGLAALAAFPRRYVVQARILAQRNPVMWTLSNPNLARPGDWDVPTRAARQTVLRRDNLTALCKQINFVDWYLRSRAPAVRWRDAVVELVTKEPTAEERLDDLVDTLEKRLWVEVGNEGTVTITFEWSDKDIAYNMVQAALQNFLEVRHATEVSIVGEAISILENHAQKLREEIEGTIDQYKSKEARFGPKAAPRRVRPQTPAKVPDSQEVAQMKTIIATKLRVIEDLERFRSRRLAELEAQLAQQLDTYAEKHPVIQTLRLNIQALKDPSPQIQGLRNEVQDLENEIIRRGGTLAQFPREIERRIGLRDLETVDLTTEEHSDPRLEYERGQLRLLVRQYSNVNDRIDSARMEMDTVQAAFKYRYSIMTPPQMPKKPKGPHVAVLVAIILFAGVVFMFFAAAVVGVRSGVVVERWQIERELSLPVLAHMRDPQ